MTFSEWYAAECERLHALPDGQRESWCRAAWERAVVEERERAAKWSELYYEPALPTVGEDIAHIIRLGDPVPELPQSTKQESSDA